MNQIESFANAGGDITLLEVTSAAAPASCFFKLVAAAAAAFAANDALNYVVDKYFHGAYVPDDVPESHVVAGADLSSDRLLRLLGEVRA